MQQKSPIASIPRFSSLTALQNYDQNCRSTEALDLHFSATNITASLIESTPLSSLTQKELSAAHCLGLDIESIDSDDENLSHSRIQIESHKFLPFKFDSDPSSSFDEGSFGNRNYGLEYGTNLFSENKCPRAFSRPRTVRFAPSLVSEVHYRPRTTDSEWSRYYYSAHELQNTIDEMRNQKSNRRIVAEEEDFDIW